nr:MAG TPA: hypothetical protein [Caudoviricetes sp.]
MPLVLLLYVYLLTFRVVFCCIIICFYILYSFKTL